MTYALAAPTIFFLMRALWATCRVKAVLGEDNAAGIRASDEPVVICYWHGEILVTGFYLERCAKRRIRLNYMVSPSVDGDLVTKILERGNAHVVRGSATRTGIKSLRHMLRALKRERTSPVILPDGPVGPANAAKPGAIMLAQMSGARILPLAGAVNRSIRLKTWDSLRFPLPFTQMTIAYGEPLPVAPNLTVAEVEQASTKLTNVLNELRARAHEHLGVPLDAK